LKAFTTWAPGSRAWSSSELVTLVFVEGSDVAVPPWVVVVGIDHGLANERLSGNIADRLQRDRHDDQITSRGRLLARVGTGSRAEFGDQIRQRLRSP
jgi:hypothetical protein